MDRRGALASLLGLALAPRTVRAAGAQRLVARHPGVAKLPWLALAALPTPLEEAPELARALGVGRLFVKRDDRTHAAHGGSKLRKLELFLADAEDQGRRAIAAVGGVGSNQTLATAFFAKERGLASHLFLMPERPSPEVRAHLLAQAALGAEQRLVGTEAQAFRAIAKHPARPYSVPTGGSSPLGNVGFVEAGLELASQVRADAVYLALGTAGSAVGLALGLSAAGLATKVIAVRAASPRYGTPRQLRLAARETSELIAGYDATFPVVQSLPNLTVREGFVGKGYAEPTAAGRHARKLVRSVLGLELDLTYTAKAFAALQADAKSLRGKTVVFWSSWDARPIDAGAAGVSDLPRELRGYAR